MTTIAKLIENTLLARYTWKIYITYDRGGELFGSYLKHTLIAEEYGIKSSPDYPGNVQSNTSIDIIHQVLGNLVFPYNLQES